MAQTLIVANSEVIQEIVSTAVLSAVDKITPKIHIPLNSIHHVDVKKAAFMEGVSVPMIRKIQDQYTTKLVGSKRVFRVENGELVRKSTV